MKPVFLLFIFTLLTISRGAAATNPDCRDALVFAEKTAAKILSAQARDEKTKIFQDAMNTIAAHHSLVAQVGERKRALCFFLSGIPLFQICMVSLLAIDFAQQRQTYPWDDAVIERLMAFPRRANWGYVPPHIAARSGVLLGLALAMYPPSYAKTWRVVGYWCVALPISMGVSSYMVPNLCYFHLALVGAAVMAKLQEAVWEKLAPLPQLIEQDEFLKILEQKLGPEFISLQIPQQEPAAKD